MEEGSVVVDLDRCGVVGFDHRVIESVRQEIEIDLAVGRCCRHHRCCRYGHGCRSYRCLGGLGNFLGFGNSLGNRRCDVLGLGSVLDRLVGCFADVNSCRCGGCGDNLSHGIRWEFGKLCRFVVLLAVVFVVGLLTVGLRMPR